MRGKRDNPLRAGTHEHSAGLSREGKKKGFNVGRGKSPRQVANAPDHERMCQESTKNSSVYGIADAVCDNLRPKKTNIHRGIRRKYTLSRNQIRQRTVTLTKRSGADLTTPARIYYITIKTPATKATCGEVMA